MTNGEKKPNGLCLHHFEHAAALNDLKGSIEKNREDHKEMWIDIKNKVSMKVFLTILIIIVGFFGSTLAFQLIIYDSIKAVDKQVAVVQEQIKKNHKDEPGLPSRATTDSQ